MRIDDIKKKPRIPLAIVDRALGELAAQRKEISKYRQSLRSMETKFYRLSGFHRYRQKRVTSH